MEDARDQCFQNQLELAMYEYPSLSTLGHHPRMDGYEQQYVAEYPKRPRMDWSANNGGSHTALNHVNYRVPFPRYPPENQLSHRAVSSTGYPTFSESTFAGK